MRRQKGFKKSLGSTEKKIERKDTKCIKIDKLPITDIITDTFNRFFIESVSAIANSFKYDNLNVSHIND